MGVVSTSEDILDRLIDDVRSVQNDLVSVGDGRKDAEAHLKRCEQLCEHLLARLEYAKSLATNPNLSNPLRIAVLEIEKSKSDRELKNARKEIERLRNKFSEHRSENEKDLSEVRADLILAENQIRSLRKELKSKNEAIGRFGRTHRVEKSPKTRVLRRRGKT
jgi:chromosome segregation ATPase